MNIKIHRGLNQIGGCITEISTATSRIFVDFGKNLPGNEYGTPEMEDLLIESIFKDNPKQYESVFYTHAHEDHVGLFDRIPENIPQYISEGGKELLLTKYGILKDLHEKLKDKYCKSDDSAKDCRKEAGLEKNCADAVTLVERLQAFKTWKKTSSKELPATMTVGNIKVTPFFNCHSIYDSHMFLIEADGQRIWHTGDYREHGYMGKGLIPTLKKYATDIDVLITEGTMLKREDMCIHEREVARKMECVMKAFKYVFILASSTDIERLASIKTAAENAGKEYYVCSEFMHENMKMFTAREASASNGLFDFHPKFYSDRKLERMRKNGFVLISNAAKCDFVNDLKQKFDPQELILIYSCWDGYYKDHAQIKANPRYKQFREMFNNVVDIHTSGHADRHTIQKVIETVKPKEVICIHKEADAKL